MLIAAEWPIYGRFGYGMAVEAAATIIDSLTAELVDPSMRGSVEIVDLPVLRELAPPVFDAHRLRTPGAIHRNAVHWDLLVDIVVHPEDPPSKKRLHVIHRDPNGAVDGYAIYEPGEERWVHNRPQIAVTVSHLIATNDAAEADLWKYLCSIDWVSEVRANVRAVDEDLRQLFVNGRVARQADRSDHMWVRLVDTASALSARRYETPVSLVLDVRDRVFGDARYRLDGDATGASCTRTDDPADVELDVSVLGALYLGGTPLHPYALSGRVTERTEGAIDALDRGMRTARAPWATTSF
jgi:predicted acetyltransferase